VKRLKLPPRLSLRVPPYLEGERLKIELTFEDVEELKSHIAQLSEISEKEELKAILEML